MTQDQLYEAVDDAHRHNFQVGVHANGDVTIDMVLKAYERALQKWPDPNRRHRIEHCTLVNPDLIRRIKASGVIPTPFWTYVYYHGEKWIAYGDDKVAGCSRTGRSSTPASGFPARRTTHQGRSSR